MSKNRGQSLGRRSRRANPFKITSNQARRQAQGRGNAMEGNNNSLFNLPSEVKDDE